jgi:hypothetical protein
MMLWRTQELDYFPWRKFVPKMVMEDKVVMIRMMRMKRIKRMKRMITYRFVQLYYIQFWGGKPHLILIIFLFKIKTHTERQARLLI